MVSIDGNPSQTVDSVVYDEYDGAFPVHTIVSPVEFTYKLPSAAITSPATSSGSVNIYVKSPVLKMYYGHQYLFDVGHSSMAGGNLSFSKDNLYKLEYSFNSIERVGTPGITGQGVPNPTVKLKVDTEIVTNISYYFDPSRTGADSPVIASSYLDVVNSPYVGNFTISSTSGATITRGADTFKFVLANEPEGNADVINTSYSTSSLKAVGSINDIRIVNGGGFYTRLPVVTSIQSSRQIERIQIDAPGTEYAVGVYNSVPIAGDGEGGFVSITVADGTDDDGVTIPGQIQSVVVTSPGKGYTTASIDVESISGILGAGLTGSGVDLNVVIPPAGTGASIFTKGTKVGKIKKLQNNNFGYDYPHDYTLRPEISFPINAQLTSTSILDSITVTDPGSGYSQAPTVVITGGGGQNATAEASIKNGRLDDILVKDPGSGYSSAPTVALRSSFNYVVNLDLGLLQFAFPHGIVNGSEVTLTVTDTGDGAEFPLSAGAVGRLNSTNTYYAIAGTANSLEENQLKIAITAANAALGDSLSFVNAGTGRQTILTESFGGAATANVVTSTFLEGELVYQGDTLDAATASGYVSTNQGWQVGPRIIKIVDYTGNFNANERITGVISKSSGIISDLKIARGVLEIGSITKTTGQFIDDIGKPSEIIQKIQDSYYYQDFSYAVKSAVSIGEWKEILLKNVHPASFKVFGELNLAEYGQIPNKETDFQITKAVELAREAIVPNIQSFALVEPVYSQFNNSEVLFRQKRLTSSENILTSVVQRIDDISNQFDGVKTQFQLKVNGDNVVANANQLMIILNGVAQTPETSFNIQGDSIVFSQPPQPPASIKYVNVTIQEITISVLEFTNISGIFPLKGNTMAGQTSLARFTVTSVVGNSIFGFFVEGTAFTVGELVSNSATGFIANYASVSTVSNLGLFVFGEQVSNLTGETAKVEAINLAGGSEAPLGQLRYGIGPSTASVEIVAAKILSTDADTPPAAGTFIVGGNYQIGSEIVNVTNVTTNNDSVVLEITRGELGTTAATQAEDGPVYATTVLVNDKLTLSKTTGTYQSTPGLFDLALDDVIIGAQSGVVARLTATSTYQDPTTNEFIGQVNISEGSSFFGLLFNRVTSITYPNIVLDDISLSTISVVDYTDYVTDIDSQFPANEFISQIVIPYDNASGSLSIGEKIRNYKFDYGNNVGTFNSGEAGKSRKLSFKDKVGTGLFSTGDTIRTRDTKAEVIGFNFSGNTIYLGKIGRSLRGGGDYHVFNFSGSAQLDTSIKKFGDSSLQLDLATSDYIQIPASSEFTRGTGDYTIEFWIRLDAVSLADTKTLVDMRTSATEVALRIYLEAAQVRVNVNGSDIATSGGNALNNNIWYHLVIQRTGTTVKIISNGVEIGTGTDSGNYTLDRPIRIGADLSGLNSITAHIDEFRYSTVARYATIPFTSPNGIFQGDTDTKVLCHFDGADGATKTEDWSGGESFTKGEYVNNDSILTTNSSNPSAAPAGFNIKSHRYINAADLMLMNKEYLAQETVYIMKEVFPAHSVKGSEVDCEDDVRDVVDSIIEDLRNGSNHHMWKAASYYVNREVNPIQIVNVEDDVSMTVYVYEILDKLAKYIVNNVPWSTQGDHGLTQKYDTSITFDGYTSQTLTKFTPTAIDYHPSMGDMEITAASHGLAAPRTITATGSGYTATTGVLTIVSVAHSLETGDRIKFEPNSITMTCTCDGNVVSQSYPRDDDPANQGWLEVSKIDNDNFSVNVGTSPTVNFTATSADYNSNTGFLTMDIGDNDLRPGSKYTVESAAYNPTSGVMTVGIGNDQYNVTDADYSPTSGDLEIFTSSHNLKTGQKVKIANDGLTFRCSQDDYATDHPYPRATDPARNTALEVLHVTDESFTVNVGKSPIVEFDVSNATFNPNTGDMELTIGNHSLASGTSIRIATQSIGFTCTYGAGVHYYPRPLIDEHVPSDASYNPTTGVVTFTVNQGHGMKNGDKVKIPDYSLTFTCDKDNNATEHRYPRPYDPISDRWIEISNVQTTSIDVQVLDTAPSTNTSTHTFVSFTDVISQKRDKSFEQSIAITATTGTTITINVGVSSNTTTHTYSTSKAGAVITGGNYKHKFRSALDNAITVEHGLYVGDRVMFDRDSLTFTCLEDSGATEHTYPRITDPYYNKWLPISNVTHTTFDVQVLSSTPSTNQTAHTFVRAKVNGLTRSGETLKLAKDALSFTCSQDNDSTVHSYPRVDDSVYNTAIPIWSNGNTRMTAEGASYNTATGLLTINILNHGLTVGTELRLENNSLVFTCAKDGNKTEHSYPRRKDPYAARWLRIKAVSDHTFTVFVGEASSTGQYAHTFVRAVKDGIVKRDNTVTVNVGATPTKAYTPSAATYNASTGALELNVGTHSYPAPTQHTPTDVAYNPVSGVMTLTIAGHNFSNGEKIKIADNGIKLSCPYGGATGTAAQKDYPRSTDPVSNKWIPIFNVTTDTFDVQVLDAIPSTNVDTHTFVSAVTNSVSKANYTVKLAPDSLLMTCDMDTNATKHVYPRSNVATHTPSTGTSYNPVTGALTVSIPTESFTASSANYNVTSGACVLTISQNAGSYNVTGATYSPSVGTLVLTLGTHSLTTSDRIKITPESLKFTCDYNNDNNTTVHPYPRAAGAYNSTNSKADYAYDTWLDISAVTGTSITVNVNGGQGAITDISNHTFVGALDGAVQVGHGIVPGNKVKLAPNSLTFTCTLDGNTAQKSYPRSTGANTTSGADYAYDKWLRVMDVGDNTITVNLNGGQGAISDTSAHTFVSATTNGITLGHGMVAGTPIKIKDGGVTFRCAHDNNATLHPYPRSTDPASDKWLFIKNVSDTQFEVDILQGTTPTNTTTHTYAGSLDNCIIQGDPLVAQAIPIDAVTGNTITINALDGYTPSFTPNHTLDSVATSQFTPTNAVYNGTTGLMTITVLTANFQPSTVAYNAITGEMQMTIGTHSLAVGEEILIAPNSLTFTCDYNGDGNTTNKTYPRATGAATPSGADFAYNNQLVITDTTGTTITVNVNGGGGAITDTTNHVFVSALADAVSVSHGMKNGEKIKIADNGITFTCTHDSNASNHPYPRVTDPASGRWLDVHNVTNTTFDVQVLDEIPSTNTTTHTFVSATTNAITRAIVSTGGNYKHKFISGLTNGVRTGGDYTHTFVSATSNGIHVAGDSIYIDTNSLRFTCSQDNHETQHDYPRATDPAAKHVMEVKTKDDNRFVVNVGKSPQDKRYDHLFVSGNANSITKSKYVITNCSDVYTTTNNLIDILRDTITQAALPSPVDHLASITDLLPVDEFVGGTIHSYLEVPFKVTYEDDAQEMVYTDRIDVFSRYRFRDAANLIRQNTGAIVDKASYDMLIRYPALYQDMPRNQGGGSTDGIERCKTDLTQVCGGLANDIENGGNKNVVAAAGFYIGQFNEIQHIRLQLLQSIYVHNRLVFYLKQAIDGSLTTDNTENLIVGDWGITNDDSVTTYDVYNASYDAGTGDLVMTLASNTGTFSVSGAVYNPTSGDLTLTIGTHTLTTNDKVGIAEESLVFTCDYNGNGNQTQKRYPRSFGAGTTNGADYAYNQFLDITQVNQSGGTITVNVNGGQGAITDTTTHNFVVTPSATNAVTVGHGFTAGDSLQIGNEALTFTCSMDGNVSNKTYPRATDPAYGKALTITSATTTTVTVNVGTTPEVKYTPTFATYTATTGVLVLTIGNHNLEVGQPVKINQGALKFTCAMDGNESIKSYPRTSDPFYNKPIDITATTADTIQLNVGQSPIVLHTVSNATYDPTTGVMVLTIGSHTLTAGTSIKLATESLVFTCTLDGNTIQKSYPRATTANTGTGADYAYDTAINIDSADTAAGTITINVNGGQGAISDTSAHTFVSANAGAVRSGGDYVHTFHSADTESIIAGGEYTHVWAGGTATDAVSVIGDCADVKSNIESLINTVNDIIAPTGLDYDTAGNRLYFNRELLASDVTSRMLTEFTYQAGPTTYFAFQFDGNNISAADFQADVEVVIQNLISDLQTGGNNSSIRALQETYLNSDGTLHRIEDMLMPTVYGMEVLKEAGREAIRNNVYNSSENIPFGGYVTNAAQAAFRDDLETVDIDQVIGDWNNLLDHVIEFFSPGKKEARNGMKNILYNVNYYKNELNNLVNTQFGNGAWVYNDFVDELVGNIVQDSITTPIDHKTTARRITVTSVSGEFIVGEVVTANGGGYAQILEWDSKDRHLYVGPFLSGTISAGETLTGGTQGGGTIPTGGVGIAFDWYTQPSNVEILRNARLISSTVQDQLIGENVGYNYPEDLSSGNTLTEVTIGADSAVAPDNAISADKIIASSTVGEHLIHRNYSLNAFETFDGGTVKFDSSTETFDTGQVGTTESQQFTYSVFLKAGEYSKVRFEMALDRDTTEKQQLFYDIDLTDGSVGSIFQPQGGLTVDGTGVIPYGGGWYRAYGTITCSFGFSQLRQQIQIKNATGQTSFAGNASDGLYAWGLKLTKGAIDPYAATTGDVFYADTEYNIKSFTIDRLEEWIYDALKDQLLNPSPESGFVPFFSDSASTYYHPDSIQRLVRYSLEIVRNQLLNSTYYTDIIVQNAIGLPTKDYGTFDFPVALAGGLAGADYLYGLESGSYAELEKVTMNEGEIVQVYQRFRIDANIVDGPYFMNEVVQKQGDSTVTGVVYAFYEDENFKYLDVAVTGGTWTVLDYVVGATNSTTAQINAIEDRIQITGLQGEFVNNIPFKGYDTGETAIPTGFLKSQAAVLDNSGGKLTVDTESLIGNFETSAVIYPEQSKLFMDVARYEGLDVLIGYRISSAGHTRIGITIQNNKNVFVVGNKLNKITNGIIDINNYGYITEVDLDNNILYYILAAGNITNGDQVGDFGVAPDPLNPLGYAVINTKLDVAGAASAVIQDIKEVGVNKRFYLTNVTGTFSGRDGIFGKDNYKAAVITKTDLRGRVERAFRGFDGTQTNFKLTISNGTKYFPDPAGHMLIFINGVLQPPGSANAYTAFSDNIQFTEAPDLGASFTGFYVGKLRQLDDISFEFDSLRQSFNLKRDDVFYSLTLTDGVQSSTILPENNIICSLNGVIQEPGVGFELVGSRIIFSEIPRVGSTFVAFSYVGSEADVDAAEVVPPIEVGDFIDIQGETEDRQVAVIESSNSLITFDYLGSVFGQNAQASASLTSGTIDKVQVTSGGSGYTTRPNVRVDSISGFDGNIRALIGVAGVEISNVGSGYQNPEINVETSVPDDWTAPDLSLYGEEGVDPETP